VCEWSVQVCELSRGGGVCEICAKLIALELDDDDMRL